MVLLLTTHQLQHLSTFVIYVCHPNTTSTVISLLFCNRVIIVPGRAHCNHLVCVLKKQLNISHREEVGQPLGAFPHSRKERKFDFHVPMDCGNLTNFPVNSSRLLGNTMLITFCLQQLSSVTPVEELWPLH